MTKTELSENPTPLFKVSGRSGIYITSMLTTSLLCNILAIFLPFSKVSRFMRADVVTTLPSSVTMMWNDDLKIVAVLILFFSIIFPFLKLSILFYLWFFCKSAGFRQKLIHYIEPLGKWSMLDVFVICIILVLTDNQLLVASEIMPGVYFFLTAIFLSIFSALKIEKLSLLQSNAKHEKEIAIIRLQKMDYFDRGIVTALLMLSITSLVMAIDIPYLKITDLLLTNNEYSIITSFTTIWGKSPVLMYFILLTLIICPALHIAGIMTLWLFNMDKEKSLKLQSLVHIISKFNMLDVFLLSLLLFMTEGEWLIETERRFGLTMLVLFLISTFLIPIALRGSYKKWLRLIKPPQPSA